MHKKQEAFSKAVAQVKTEAEAKQVIQAFLEDTHVQPVANSASAGLECNWLCEQNSK